MGPSQVGGTLYVPFNSVSGWKMCQVLYKEHSDPRLESPGMEAGEPPAVGRILKGKGLEFFGWFAFTLHG